MGGGLEVQALNGIFEGLRKVQELSICHWYSMRKVWQGDFFGLGRKNRRKVVKGLVGLGEMCLVSKPLMKETVVG